MWCSGWVGSPGTPFVFETTFGWVLAETINEEQPSSERVTTYCTSVPHSNDLLRKFWKVEDCISQSRMTGEERMVLKHFQAMHSRDISGRYIVTMPERVNVTPLGDSRAL